MNTKQFDGHTPGPWEAEHVAGGDIHIWADDSVLYRVTPEEGADRQVIEADAQLIAAAPDLLAEVERLQQMVRELFDKVDDDFAFSWAVKNIGEQDMPWFRGEEE